MSNPSGQNGELALSASRVRNVSGHPAGHQNRLVTVLDSNVYLGPTDQLFARQQLIVGKHLLDNGKSGSPSSRWAPTTEPRLRQPLPQTESGGGIDEDSAPRYPDQPAAPEGVLTTLPFASRHSSAIRPHSRQAAGAAALVPALPAVGL